MIVYASLTGNTEEIAYALAAMLRASKLEVEIEESMQVDVEEFLDYDICIVATYTYGTAGELPDEIMDFYEELAELDLSGKTYAVLGSGQDFYTYFCRAVDYFEEQFQKTGAIRGADSLKFELNAQSTSDQKRLQHFARRVVKTFQHSP